MNHYKFYSCLYAFAVLLYFIISLASIVSADDFESDDPQDFEVTVESEEDNGEIPHISPYPVLEDPAPDDPAPEDPAPDDPAPEDPAPEDLYREDKDYDNNKDTERYIETINKLNESIYQIQLELQDIKKQDSLYYKNYLESTSSRLDSENKKNVTEEKEEITLSDIHDDNFKIMICLFLCLGVIIGFFMISRFLI